MLKIEDFKHLSDEGNIYLTKHARVRLKERGISILDIVFALKNGEIIRQYEDDKPFKSCLIFGSGVSNMLIHVVASIDEDKIYIITAYRPNTSQWDIDFKTRRKH